MGRKRRCRDGRRLSPQVRNSLQTAPVNHQRERREIILLNSDHSSSNTMSNGPLNYAIYVL